MMSETNSTNTPPLSSLDMMAGLRADMYHLLAVGLAEPTRELAKGLIDAGFQTDVRSILEWFALSGEDAADIDATLNRLTASAAGEAVEAVYHELNMEYTRLFIAPLPVLVSPYESIYVDSAPDMPALLMVGPAASAVLEAYREAGLDMKEGLNEPPDHIATELEFMYYLNRQEFTARQQGQDEEADRWRRLQQAFITDHLGQWAMAFYSRLQKMTQAPFYMLMARLMCVYLEREGVRRDQG